jgi:hypothetical protein
MATTVTSLTELGTVQAHPSGTLGWAHVKCSMENTDEIIDSTKILAKWGASGNASGTIIQVCDGGGTNLVLSGGATGISLCTNVIRSSGDITFRSYNDGKADAIKCAATTDLEIIVMIRF